jgi:glycosyltransferase involved in cell wall biosynthesis
MTPFLHLGDPDDPRDRTRRGYLAPPLRWLLRQAERVFVHTPSEQAAAITMGVEAERVVLQGLGVASEECSGGDRARARSMWGIAPGAFVFGHLANLSVEKGSVDLLAAVASLWQSGLNATVVLAGPDMSNFRRFWRRFCREHPEKSRTHVVRLGVLSEEQKKDFYACLDAFVLPSRSDSFGLVLLEAWANSLPNIAYRAGGPADLVRHEQDGLLIPCGDVAGLARAMTRVVQDDSLCHSLGATGRRRIEPEFRWEQKLEMVRQTYEQCVKERRR